MIENKEITKQIKQNSTKTSPTRSSPNLYSPPKKSEIYSRITISSSMLSSNNEINYHNFHTDNNEINELSQNNIEDNNLQNNLEKIEKEGSTYILNISSNKEMNNIFQSPIKKSKTEMRISSSLFPLYKTSPECIESFTDEKNNKKSENSKIFDKLFKFHKEKNFTTGNKNASNSSDDINYNLNNNLSLSPQLQRNNKLKVSEFYINDNVDQKDEKINDENLFNLSDLSPKSLDDKISFYPTLEISITGYIIKNFIFQHVKYTISILKKGDKEKVVKFYRRYSEFLKLREMLVKKYLGVFIPSLPLKEIFGNTEINLIEFRKKFLQIFMHEIQICYFFKESEEIQTFLDPNIENFPPDNLLILLKMTNESDDLLIDEVLKITKRKLSENYIENQNDYISSQVIEMKINIPKFNLNETFLFKSVDSKKIISNIKNIKNFSKLLEYKKTILENVLTVLKHLIFQQKESSNLKIRFIEEMRNFQNSFIFAMNDNINVFNYNSDKSILSTDNNLKKMEIILQEEKSFEKLLKNMHDWIYKEIINIDSCMDCINSLNPFMEKLKNVNEEIKKMFTNMNQMKNQMEMEYEYINFDVKEKLENKLENLKEIVALNSMFVWEVELMKYKSCRFVYYYNSLKFAFLQNKNSYNDNTFFTTCLLNMIGMMKMYLNNNFRYKKYFESGKANKITN